MAIVTYVKGAAARSGDRSRLALLLRDVRT